MATQAVGQSGGLGRGKTVACAACSAQDLPPSQRIRLLDDLGRPIQLFTELEAALGSKNFKLREDTRVCCRLCWSDILALMRLREHLRKCEEFLTKVTGRGSLKPLSIKRPLQSPWSQTGVSSLPKKHVPEPSSTPQQHHVAQEKSVYPVSLSSDQQQRKSPTNRKQAIGCSSRQLVPLGPTSSSTHQKPRCGITQTRVQKLRLYLVSLRDTAWHELFPGCDTTSVHTHQESQLLDSQVFVHSVLLIIVLISLQITNAGGRGYICREVAMRFIKSPNNKSIAFRAQHSVRICARKKSLAQSYVDLNLLN